LSKHSLGELSKHELRRATPHLQLFLMLYLMHVLMMFLMHRLTHHLTHHLTVDLTRDLTNDLMDGSLDEARHKFTVGEQSGDANTRQSMVLDETPLFICCFAAQS
jgi:ABC-type uncharacterized transport system fused permease/ATPase subunit